MKYIRTKNGIFRKYKNSKIIDNVFYYPDNGMIPEYKRELILNQANTIEELCDDFVFIVGEGKLIVNNFTQAKKYYNSGKKENADFSLFGAIWTDKGLIYVAKMNDKGELELL